MKLVAYWSFPLRNLYIDFYPSETEFVYGTCCVLIFVRLNLFHVYFSLRKTYTFIFHHLKKIFFMKLVACWFLYVKFVACWFFSSRYWFSSWNLLSADFCSCNLLHFDLFPHETDFVHGTCWELIFVRGTGCVLIYVRGTCCLPIFAPGAWCVLIFFSSKLFACWFFLLAKLLKLEFVACIILLLEPDVYWFLFVKLVTCWFFSLWIFSIDISSRKYDFFIEQIVYWFSFLELVACWFLYV